MGHQVPMHCCTAYALSCRCCIPRKRTVNPWDAPCTPQRMGMPPRGCCTIEHLLSCCCMPHRGAEDHATLHCACPVRALLLRQQAQTQQPPSTPHCATQNTYAIAAAARSHASSPAAAPAHPACSIYATAAAARSNASSPAAARSTMGCWGATTFSWLA